MYRFTLSASLLLVLACTATPAPVEETTPIGGKGDAVERADCDVCIDDWMGCEDAANDGADLGRCWMIFGGCIDDGLVGLCSAAPDSSAACDTCSESYTSCANGTDDDAEQVACWDGFTTCIADEGETGLCAVTPLGPTRLAPVLPCDACNADYDACEAEADGAPDSARCWMNYGACLEFDMLVGLCSAEDSASPACVACGEAYTPCVDNAQDGGDLGACYLSLQGCVMDAGEVGYCDINDEAAPDPCDVCGEAYAACGETLECQGTLASCVESAELVGTCQVVENADRPCVDCIERLSDCEDDAQDGGDLGMCWLGFQECVEFIEEVGLCAAARP